MPWPKLTKGILVKRYKRFLADVRLASGEIVTAHCPNSGSMKGCCEPGRPVYLSWSDNPKRRFRFTWELVAMPSSLVCVNTGMANKLVGKSIVTGLVPELSGYRSLRSEVPCGTSRIDIVLEAPERPRCFIEIKSSTMVEDRVARFPDAVTTRGRKHLVELQEQVRVGNRGVIFFLVQRTDAAGFRPADSIDPAYGGELRKACQNGVEIVCYDVRLTVRSIALRGPIPCDL
ncbi:MAG: DNA/RNA nuclease SfsA [Desulfomonile tiedjei]|nr:DNA/RNA nuclease SfsA [Desulfomonile tiedjei]